MQKLGVYLPETYQYFPIFTDFPSGFDTIIDTIFIVLIISRYQNSKEYEISDNEIRSFDRKKVATKKQQRTRST